MRKQIIFLWELLLFLGCILPSCKEDVELSEIDTSIGIDMGIALPVGTIEATLGDFIGNEAIAPYIEVDSTTGIIAVKYNSFVRWNFHPVDLSNYSTHTTQEFYLKDASLGGTTLPPTGVITFPASSPVKYIDFPCSFSIDNLNTDVDYEKIDSLHILEAHFMSNVQFSGFTPAITEQNITKLEVIFDGKSFRFDNGEMSQEFPLDKFQFGTDMDITLRNFTLTPQKNELGKYEDAHFSVRIHFETEQLHAYNESSFLQYGFGLNFLDFDILYGVFEPRKATEKLEIVRDSLSKYLPMDDLKGMRLPFADPQIKLTPSTSSVGMPCMLIVKELYVENEQGTRKNLYHPTLTNEMVGYALPAVRSPYATDSVTLAPLKLSKDEDEGDLDALFAISPLYFGYSYYIKVNKNALDYATFIKNNAEYGLKLEASLPLQFNAGLSLSYRDTMPMTLSDFQIDSLINYIPLVDTLTTASVRLKLLLENKIPFDFGLKLRFLDEEGEIIQIAGLYDGGMNDSITMDAFTETNHSQKALTIEITDQEAALIASVEQIYYDVFLGNNKSLAALKDSDGLRIKVGLAGKVAGEVSFGNLNKEDEEYDEEY